MLFLGESDSITGNKREEKEGGSPGQDTKTTHSDGIQNVAAQLLGCSFLYPLQSIRNTSYLGTRQTGQFTNHRALMHSKKRGLWGSPSSFLVGEVQPSAL